jgi:hypothetical protein
MFKREKERKREKDLICRIGCVSELSICMEANCIAMMRTVCAILPAVCDYYIIIAPKTRNELLFSQSRLILGKSNLLELLESENRSQFRQL